MLIAHVGVAFACFCGSRPAHVSFLPDDGDAEVPIDVWPSISHDAETDADASTLTRLSDGATIPFDFVVVNSLDAWLTVMRPVEMLDPDTSYEVVFTGRFDFVDEFPIRYAWTTGTLSAPPPSPVGIDVGPYTYNKEGRCYHDSYLDLVVTGEVHSEIEVAVGTDEPFFVHSLTSDVRVGVEGCVGHGGDLPPGETLTLRARGVGLNGDVSEWSEPVTFEVPAEPCGCATTSPSVWAVLPVLLLVRRRRTC